MPLFLATISIHSFDVGNYAFTREWKFYLKNSGKTQTEACEKSIYSLSADNVLSLVNKKRFEQGGKTQTEACEKKYLFAFCG